MKQITMIIIDDEPIILRGLAETYSWSELGFTIVGTATNPEIGLELIKEKKPQVVLTDIKMKHMSGLTLMNKVKVFAENITFVVMSAYKEFEYAKKACDLGAFAYLVKPIEDEVLKHTMQSVYEYCAKKTTIEGEYGCLKKMLLDNKESFQNVILERYLKEEVEEESFIKALMMIGETINEDNSFVGLYIGFDIAYCILNEKEFEVQGFAVFNYLEKQILKSYNGWQYRSGPDKMVFIIKLKDKCEGIEKIKDIIDDARKMTDMDIVSVISSVFCGIKGLKLAYAQIQEMYNLACESGAHLLVGKSDTELRNKERKYSENEELFIINSIRKGDEQALKEAYVHFLLQIERSYRSEYIKKCLHRIALSVEFFLYDSYEVTQEVKASFDNFYTLLPSLSKEKAEEILLELLKKAIGMKNRCSAEKSKKYFSDYISKALEYIDENLVDEKLSITSVSEYVYLNPVYFGRLFKSALNMSFKQYVLSRRIDLAKKKIIEESSNIVTIGNEIGIPNSSYFTQVFKKITGYLPSDYKKEIINEIN